MQTDIYMSILGEVLCIITARGLNQCLFLHLSGRLYDATGQLNNLWTQYSINNFISRQQCYIDEYSSLTLFGIAASGMQCNFQITHQYTLNKT